MHSGTYRVNVGHYTNASGWVEEPEDFQVHFNGDYSGDIKVQLGTQQLIDRLEAQGGASFINLPYDLLEQIVMDKLREDLINKIEQLEPGTLKELLKVVL